MEKKNISVPIGCIVLTNITTGDISVTSFTTWELACEKYDKWLAEDKRMRDANVVENGNCEYQYSAGGNRHKCTLVKSDMFNHSDGFVDEQLPMLEL